MKTFIVKREHFGDRMYSVGEERDADAAMVAHLVANGVLALKAATKPQNKAAKPLKNKAG